MIPIRLMFLVLLVTLLHDDVYSQEKPDTSAVITKDFDGDGVNDNEDRCINEKGPASNFGCPVTDPLEGMLVYYPAMRTVFFASGSSSLLPKSIKDLQNTVKFLKEWPGLNVNLDGHSDNLGSDELNRSLCIARIKAVKLYLMKAGINKNRITDTVHGAIHPIDNPETKTGREMNRRVEITTYKKSINK